MPCIFQQMFANCIVTDSIAGQMSALKGAAGTSKPKRVKRAAEEEDSSGSDTEGEVDTESETDTDTDTDEE